MTITKRDVADTLYLSCVENYFLAWLGKIYDVTKLYGSSFVGIGQIFDDFSRGATYENYCNIPRLQDVAEEYGIVRHEYKRCSAKDAVRVLREQPKSTLSLARVNMNFFEGYKRASWPGGSLYLPGRGAALAESVSAFGGKIRFRTVLPHI